MGTAPQARTVWQISGGPPSRPYEETFLRYGVALLGPGDAGPWNPERDDDEFEGGFVRRFASEVSIGDALLLRTGIARICAVGLVASGYQYLHQFDDVNGMDLQHTRRVRWCRLPRRYEFGTPVFGANPSRFSRIGSEHVVDYINRFLNSPPIDWQVAQLPALPVEESILEEIPSDVQGLIAEVQDLVPLLWDRQAFGEHPTEDELVAHFVVPLLRSLGWATERIAVKWRYIDVAVFRALPRTAEHCQFVVEAKRLGAGVEGALAQAIGYVEALGTRCDIVVTDGIRYRLYGYEPDPLQPGQQAHCMPIAYANLVRLKRSATELFSRLRRP